MEQITPFFLYFDQSMCMHTPLKKRKIALHINRLIDLVYSDSLEIGSGIAIESLYSPLPTLLEIFLTSKQITQVSRVKLVEFITFLAHSFS